MKLLVEVNEQLEYIKEEREGKDSMYIQGIFMQAEVANRNKRIYPVSVLERETNRYVTENVKRNTAFGELGHPAGPGINLDRTAILIKELKQEGTNFHGKALITNTPMGLIVKGLIQDGARLGVSSRALGSLKPLKEGLSEVQDDLRLLAIDVVADPSAPEAFVDSIMEGVDYVWDAARGTWAERYLERIVPELKESPKRVDDERRLAVFEAFLASLTKSKI